MVQQLGFVRTATARIAVAAFARLQADPDRLGRAISEGMFLQIIAIGPLLCADCPEVLRKLGRTVRLPPVLGFGGVLRLATRVLEPRRAERRQGDRRERNAGFAAFATAERRSGLDRRLRDRRVNAY